MNMPPVPGNQSFSNEKMVFNVNGKLSSKEDATIPVLDRGFLYGDSVYEVIRTYSGIPFLLQEHLDRLWHSAAKIGLPINYTQNEITHEVNKALAELEVENAYIRIILTRGEGPITLDTKDA